MKAEWGPGRRPRQEGILSPYVPRSFDRDPRRVNEKVSRKGRVLGLFLLATALAVSGAAEARVGGGSSVGSRGARTFVAPPVTQTAPRTAAPIDRTTAKAAPAQASRGLFGGNGFAGGLLAGFLGAGLFGMLFGYGFLGGLTGFGSVLGFVLQAGVIFLLARWVLGWLGRGSRPAFAGAAGSGWQRSAAPVGDLRGTASPPRSSNGRRPNDETGLKAADFDQFEELLSEIQTAYGREDLATLRRLVTPEMMDALAADLAANAKQGRVNRISGVKLLRGDLAEAWREGGSEYATVAMRFTIKDETVDRTTGQSVGFGPNEATEVWTFRRDGGGAWVLSAVQQA